MKLNTADRDAFVTAVIGDVPSVDYVTQAHLIVLDEVGAKLPAKVRAVWDSKELRGYVRCDNYFRANGFNTSFAIPLGGYTPSAANIKKLQALADKYSAQRKQRDDLRAKVRAVIESCTTLKQAKERLPEFTKYLPAERGTTGVCGLPVIANVVADLSKAGWPKDKNKAKGA